MEEYKPAIVIAAYNRSSSLQRLLKSLSFAHYYSEVTLVISIDKSENDDVYDVACDFEWNNGEKVIIRHKENLGLKDHIISCGNLTKDYGSIILLEDDLYVSPFFYVYACEALNIYCDSNHIVGISLYSPSYNENAKLSFTPLVEDSSVYFLQLPSSSGQLWTINHWDNFSCWYNSDGNNGNYNSNRIPNNISNWNNKSSWKKVFAKYMIEENKYFVYPYVSLTTNCGDAGVHFSRKSFLTQVALQTTEIDYKFKDFESAVCVYDAFYEILPTKLKMIARCVVDYDFEVDFYGSKCLSQSDKPYFLTTHRCIKFERSFGLEFKPIELNIVNDNSGHHIFLVTRSDFFYKKYQKPNLLLYEYYYRVPTLNEMFKFIRKKIAQKINDKIS